MTDLTKALEAAREFVAEADDYDIDPNGGARPIDGLFVDICRAFVALAKERGWRPIETAPRDGTPFLAWCSDAIDRPGYISAPGDALHVAIVFASHPNPDQPRGIRWVSVDVQVETFTGSEYTGSWNEYEWTPVKPIRWQPLPDAPR